MYPILQSSDIDRNHRASRQVAHNAGSGQVISHIFQYLHGNRTVRLGYAFFYYSIISAHNHDGTFIRMGMGISIDSGDLDHHFFQPSKSS